MTSAIVLPHLDKWAQGHITAITKATTQEEFDSAFDGFVAADPDVDITFNGVKISRQEYKNRLQTEAFRETGAEVVFNGTVQVPGDDGSNVPSPYVGEAGIFYTAILAEGILVLGAPQERQVTSSINIFVKNDPSLKPPTLPGGIRGFFDPRRAFRVNQVFLDRANTASDSSAGTST
ncbi:hypothetical protein D9758_015686 [Tetrapyrgos nigripes]|uniref:Uncharacterized protein n=1 Tax=Tetrapyrgos nigripes TaxID=182062 RepID=A0A8H5C7L0_9AGAR|nr:hypothetical protein D9758_015686 [Tetrapyrgos nigripes]